MADASEGSTQSFSSFSGLTRELGTVSFSFRVFFDGLSFETFSVFPFVMVPFFIAFVVVAAVMELPGVLSPALNSRGQVYISKPYTELSLDEKINNEEIIIQ